MTSIKSTERFELTLANDVPTSVSAGVRVAGPVASRASVVAAEARLTAVESAAGDAGGAAEQAQGDVDALAEQVAALGLASARGFDYADDFISGLTAEPAFALGWARVVASVGAPTATVTSDASHPGILTVTTGTSSATARNTYHLGAASITLSHADDGLVQSFEWLVMVPTLGSDTEVFTAQVGLSDGAGAAGFGTNAVSIVHSRALSPNWLLHVVVAGAPQYFDFGDLAVPVVAGAWHRFEAALRPGEAGKELVVSCDGVALGALGVASLPTAPMGPIIKIEKSLGTGARTLSADYCRYRAVHPADR